jgi:hypothetical protein
MTGTRCTQRDQARAGAGGLERALCGGGHGLSIVIHRAHSTDAEPACAAATAASSTMTARILVMILTRASNDIAGPFNIYSAALKRGSLRKCSLFAMAGHNCGDVLSRELKCTPWNYRLFGDFRSSRFLLGRDLLSNLRGMGTNAHAPPIARHGLHRLRIIRVVLTERRSLLR